MGYQLLNGVITPNEVSHERKFEFRISSIKSLGG